MKALIGLRSSTTPARFTMAVAGKRWTSPERLTGEPLIYASMGTILNGQADVFRTIVAALSKHKDLQLVLSVGDQVDPNQIGPVPSNVVS